MTMTQAINLIQALETAMSTIECERDDDRVELQRETVDNIVSELLQDPAVTMEHAIKITVILTDAVLISEYNDDNKTAKAIQAGLNTLFEIAKEN